MTPRAARSAVVVLVGFWLAGFVRPAAAATKLEGEYQLMMDLRKSNPIHPWDWDSNDNATYNGAQLRLFSQPRTGVEAFMKVEADWRTPENTSPRPQFQFREAHLRYRWDLGGRGVDSYLFSRQDRFWVDNHLIRIVESGDLKDDRFGPNAQGLRVDTWGFLGLNLAFVASDFSGQAGAAPSVAGDARGTDDVFVGRIRREFFADKRLRLGATIARRQDNEFNEIDRQLNRNNDVYHVDGRYSWRGVDFSMEYAESRSDLSAVTYADGLERDITFFRRPTGLRIPNRGVLAAEVRSLRIGTNTLGYLNVTPTYWARGPLYQNRVGDSQGQQTWFLGQNDEVGFKIDSYYLLPERAITITNSWKRFGQKASRRRDDTELYNEIYVEFVNGFTGKTYLRHYTIREERTGIRTTNEYRDWFNEVQVESRLAWLRVQTKLKDIGLPIQKHLFAAETRLNLTTKLKLYNRFTFAGESSILRRGIFSQIQYRPTGNMEMFLEYGPGWIGDDSTPVNDFDLVSGSDHEDLFKFILKGQF